MNGLASLWGVVVVAGSMLVNLFVSAYVTRTEGLTAQFADDILYKNFNLSSTLLPERKR